jgi:spermidine synthase
MRKLLYICTISLSAFLLFQVQPMIAKMILPWFGGSAAVWITAMLFFQSALLGGYLYAHWSIGSLKPKVQAVVHAVLLGASFLMLPVAPAESWKPAGGEEPVLHILGLLTVSAGLPYFLLSTTSPLLQAWYTREFQKAFPYRLFAISNLASLLGLLAYPFLVEPNLTLRQQSYSWMLAYVVFSVFWAVIASSISRRMETAACAIPGKGKMDTAGCCPPLVREQAIWLLLAGCASSLLLSVTNHITQNVASIPFLWIVPLSLYLLTFILCFDYERLYHRKVFVWLLMASLGGMAYGLEKWDSHSSLKLVIPSFLAGLFFCCMFCHGELVRRKPEPRYLTSFYLMIALGGTLGGLLVGVLAPKLLTGYFELSLTLVACAVLLLFVVPYRKWKITAAVAVAVAVYMIVAGHSYLSSYGRSARVMERNFYGGLRVLEYNPGKENEARVLVHGTVNHGMQFTTPDRRREHISYYGPESGVGLVMNSLRGSYLRVGIIGLGAGSLAAYARPHDVFRFYEINPLVDTLARTEFTYLRDARGKIEVVIGDGRLSLEKEPDQHYDLLVIDAFSGDSIPVHLLTREAMELYFRHLKPTGILALHTTNRHLDLAPIAGQLSQLLGKHAVMIDDSGNRGLYIYSTQWVLVSSSPLSSPDILDASDDLPSRPDLRIWTDDYSNLFQILK